VNNVEAKPKALPVAIAVVLLRSSVLFAISVVRTVLRLWLKQQPYMKGTTQLISPKGSSAAMGLVSG
jgi:hypothetical protein